MSTLKVTNIQATGETAGRAVSGIAAAWVLFDGTGTIAVDDSLNVSSLTDVGTGQYTINFTNNMGNAFYAYAGEAKENTSSTHGGIPDRFAKAARVPLTASNFKMYCVAGGSTYSARDVEEASAHFMGDLA
jgi:hypothetical protein